MNNTHWALELKKDIDALYLEEDLGQTGIQEKYIQSCLSADEPLSILDLRRFTHHTGMQALIPVLPFNESLGQYVQDKISVTTNDSISLTILLHTGRDYPEDWMSVRIDFNPLHNQIDYQLHAAFPLRSEQKTAYSKKLESVLQLHNPNVPIVGTIRQENGGIYPVLQALYKQQSDSALHPTAQLFLSADTPKACRQIVYESALRTLQLKPDMAVDQKNFKNGRIKEDSLQKLLTFIAPPKHPTRGQHPAVEETINALTLYQKSLRFPDTKQDAELTANDYLQLLIGLHAKFKNSGLNRTLERFTLACSNAQPLEGLVEHHKTGLTLPFHTLVLSLDNAFTDPEAFLFQLNTWLVGTNGPAFPKLQLQDDSGHLDEPWIKALTEFVVNRKIAVDITLPKAFQNSPYQQQIDAAVSNHAREKRLQGVQQHSSTDALSISPTKAIRTRPRLKGKQALAIDIELQQEQQTEVAVESTSERSSYDTSPLEKNDPSERIFTTYAQFEHAVRNGALSNAAQLHRLPTDPVRLEAFWCNTLGLFSIKDESVGISQLACEEIIRHQSYFQDGFDFYQLPAGFTEEKKLGKVTIRFSRSLQLTTIPHPLSIQIKEPQAPAILTAAQWDHWLRNMIPPPPVASAWKQLSSGLYHKSAQQTFKQYTPQMLTLSEPLQQQLFALCLDGTKFNESAFLFLMDNAESLATLLTTPTSDDAIKRAIQPLFESKTEDAQSWLKEYKSIQPQFSEHLLFHVTDDEPEAQTLISQFIHDIPSTSLNGLLQVYIQLGTAGLASLAQLAKQNLGLFRQLDASIFSKANAYLDLIEQSDYALALTAIQGFTSEERVWWDVLVAQHGAAQTQVNLVDLVNTFKAFKEILYQLPTDTGKTLKLPESCTISGVHSLPVALSRIIALLQHIPEHNRQSQLNVVSGLDLSSTGMIKAFSTPGTTDVWHFITPEMKLSAQLERAKTGKENAICFSSSKRHSTLMQVPEDFFRCTSFREKNTQLPLAFYQHVHAELSSEKYDEMLEPIRLDLYKIVAGATTGHVNTASHYSLEDNIQFFDQILLLINTTPFPRLTQNIKAKIRRSLIDCFSELTKLPEMSTLSKLINLIFSAFDTINPQKLYKTAQRLDNNATKLDRMVEKYETAVYEGMNSYQDSDYQNSNLFFEHLNIIQAIDGKAWEEYSPIPSALISLISAFHFNASDIDPLCNQFTPISVEIQLKKMQPLLTLMKSPQLGSNLPRLTANDLHLIIEKIHQHPHDKPTPALMDELIRLELNNGKKLTDYYSKDRLENFVKPEIYPAVLDKITQNFTAVQQDKIRIILLRFDDIEDHKSYEKVVDLLIKASKRLNPIEKNILIHTLESRQGLYTHKKALSAPNNAFMHLLTYIEERPADDLINLLIAERDVEKKCAELEQTHEFFNQEDSLTHAYIDGLANKTDTFLHEILPKLYMISDLAITDAELLPKLYEILLKTPLPQLVAPSSIIADDYEIFQKQTHMLSRVITGLEKGLAIDLDEANEITQAFIPHGNLDNQPNLEQFQTLLEQYNQPLDIEPQDLQSIISNTAILPIFLLLLSPTPLSEQINDATSPELKNLLKTPYIETLRQNPRFLKALSSKENLQLLAEKDVLTNPDKFQVIAKALEQDITGVKQLIKEAKTIQSLVNTQVEQKSRYANAFISMVKKINAIVIENPGSKRQFLELLDRYMQSYHPTEHGELLVYLHQFIDTLSPIFHATTNKHEVLSLCFQFNQNTEEFNPQQLLALIRELNTVPETYRQTALHIAIALINNEKNYHLIDFARLCAAFAESPEKAEHIRTAYQYPPYPDITQILAWIDLPPSRFETALKKYQLKPCTREGVNGFHPIKGTDQLREMKGFDASLIDVAAFQELTLNMQQKTGRELLDTLSSFHNASAPDIEKLVAVAAELLYRSKGKSGGPGDSMEINTTQYLAILSLLKTPGHVTSKIGTGEGKSRIMMIACVCQWALGHTVDFVTSDAQLAIRDFVGYQAYFDMVGAESSIILAQTAPDAYKKGGINFSDPSNLSLFRNKAKSEGHGALVYDSDLTKRALLLDEADKTYFDVADTRFNYSRKADQALHRMEWVYPLLIDYFVQSSLSLPTGDTTPSDLYYNNIDASREQFMAFAAGRCQKSQYNQLNAVSAQHIEQWQTSAVTALSLQYKDDYVIEPNILINTPEGAKLSSEAQLLFGNRVAKNSKFSFGIHQCLHARLNRLKQNPDETNDINLRETLQESEHPFFIAEEKQIVYSSTSKNLLDDYQAGDLKAVSGTIGSLLEQQEAKILYGQASYPMHFIEVPRDKGMQRRDRAMRLVANQTQQIKALIEQIKAARAKSQPILVIAENDQESKILFEVLNRTFTHDIQHIHSQLSAEAENKCLVSAGKSRQITVSTDMIGRGVDIRLLGDSKHHGLNVMLTYLPRIRDLEQILGRSGRQGDKGETSLILDKYRLKKVFGKSSLTDGYYKNAEAYIHREQAKMDRNKQCERLLKNSVGDFRKELTNQFFNTIVNHADRSKHAELHQVWSKFFDVTDKEWGNTWTKIQETLATYRFNLADIETALAEYQTLVQAAWSKTASAIYELQLSNQNFMNPEKLHLNHTIPALQLDKATRALLTGFDLNQLLLTKSKVYDHYDPGHEGRDVQYKHWYIPFIASIKGYLNLLGFNFSEARRPFANIRAWMEGHGRLFPSLRANPNKARNVISSIYSLIGGGVAAALFFLNVFPPLGLNIAGLGVALSSFAIIIGAGLLIGALIGFMVGKVLDNRRLLLEEPLLNPHPIEIELGESYASILTTAPPSAPSLSNASSPAPNSDEEELPASGIIPNTPHHDSGAKLSDEGEESPLLGRKPE